MRNAPLAELAPMLFLAVLAALCTTLFYHYGYHTTAFASDQIRLQFQGFHLLEGKQPRTYRWTNGSGTLCMPAVGATRPPLLAQIDLLGRAEELGVGGFAIEVGTQALPVALAPTDRRYHLLIPHGPETGPVCVHITSSAVTPPDDARALGVALRSLTLARLPDDQTPPPLHQLGLNMGLALGGFWLLRQGSRAMWRPLLADGIATLVVAVVAVVFAAALTLGRARLTTDLPALSLGATGALTAILAAGAVQSVARRATAWTQEWIAALTTGALLLAAIPAFQAVTGYVGVYPLMARIGVLFSPAVVLPLLFGGAWLALVWRWLQRPPPAALAVVVCWLAAFGLAVLLKAALRGGDSLFQTFTWHPQDYIRDVPRVGNDPLAFLRTYVAHMPELAKHNRNHPPGATLLLWAVGRIAGPGPVPATWFAIAAASLGVWPTYTLARRVGDGRTALLAAATYGLLPAQITYAATSMDAVFATVLVAAVAALTFALVPSHGSAPDGWALAAGALLALGMCFTFGTLMLGLFGGTLLLWHLWRARPASERLRLLRRAALVCGSAALILLALRAATGFDIVAALRQGTANNYDEVQQSLPPPGPATYLFFLAANAIAFCFYLGPWAVNLLLDAPAHALAEPDAPVAGPLVALAVLLAGMLLSGLFTREVERIWLFTHSLVALTIAWGITRRGALLGQRPYALLVLGALLTQSLLFRIILSIYW